MIVKPWTDFKTLIAAQLRFVETYHDENMYELYSEDKELLYFCQVCTTEDIAEYEASFRSLKSDILSPIDDEGRIYLRAESKPTYMTTYFTSRGDSETEIGGGTELVFNFNNSDDEIEAPSGFRQKMISCSFIDTVRLKEGTIYWENMPFGSYIDLCLGVPDQGYYLTNTGELRQNLTGTPLRVARFVKSSPMMGSCPMGDELNTETASFDIPPGTLFGFTVTVPSSVGFSDNCHGVVQLELYRERTVILPDE